MRKIWRRTSAALGAACVVVLAAGCAGGPPTPQVGATQAQVEAQLGTPKATFPLPDGGRQVEFNYVRGPFTYIVFFDAAGKVVEAVQVLNETNFRQVRPGMTQEQVLRLIGHPFQTSPAGRPPGNSGPTPTGTRSANGSRCSSRPTTPRWPRPPSRCCRIASAHRPERRAAGRPPPRRYQVGPPIQVLVFRPSSTLP